MIGCIWCAGKNYALHAKELGQPIEKEPIIFLKSAACIVSKGQIIRLPAFSSHIEYEVEIACLFDQELEISHFTVALDLTARDIQSKAKEKGLPWTLAKSFKQSCPLGTWQLIRDLQNTEFSLHVNGNQRQKGYVKNMLFPLDQLRDYLLKHFPVSAGDILLTGTPEGISTVISGDKAEVYCDKDHLGSWTFA